MSDEFETHPQETPEASEEAERAEVRRLDDATFEPQTYLEASMDYTQSEAIQDSFIAIVDNSMAVGQDDSTVRGNQVAAIPIPIPKPEGGEPLVADQDDISSQEIEAGVEEDQAQSELEGEARVAEDIRGPDELLPENLPEQSHLPIGEGTRGMIEKGGELGAGKGLGLDDAALGAGKGGLLGGDKGTAGGIEGYGNFPGQKMGSGSGPSGLKGYGNKGKSGGASSSGGGPPVMPGMSGKGETTHYKGSKENSSTELPVFQKMEQDSGSSCNSIENLRTGVAKLTCTTQNGDKHIYTWGNTIDGTQPQPYTGSGHWSSEKPEAPGKIGGTDDDETKEAGHFVAVVGRGGQSGGSGTAGPDDLDDSGKAYGVLFGSAGRPNNPDDPDYYTPNVLEEVGRSKKASGG